MTASQKRTQYDKTESYTNLNKLAATRTRTKKESGNKKKKNDKIMYWFTV